MANPGPDNMQDFVADIDTGGRNPAGFIGKLIAVIAFIWALFQLYICLLYTSPSPRDRG